MFTETEFDTLIKAADEWPKGTCSDAYAIDAKGMLLCIPESVERALNRGVRFL